MSRKAQKAHAPAYSPDLSPLIADCGFAAAQCRALAARTRNRISEGLTPNLPHSTTATLNSLISAQTPEEVGSVVVLNYSKEDAGTYKVVEGSGGVAAFREVCELILVDRSIPAVIHRKTFRGPEPGSATSISKYQTEVVTPVDLTEMRNYIMKLPSR